MHEILTTWVYEPLATFAWAFVAILWLCEVLWSRRLRRYLRELMEAVDNA